MHVRGEEGWGEGMGWREDREHECVLEKSGMNAQGGGREREERREEVSGVSGVQACKGEEEGKGGGKGERESPERT